MKTFKQYVIEADKTMLDSARKLDYLIPGLFAEFGEYVGHWAKEVRDGDDRSDRKLAELGDMAWFVAGIYHNFFRDKIPDIKLADIHGYDNASIDEIYGLYADFRDNSSSCESLINHGPECLELILTAIFNEIIFNNEGDVKEVLKSNLAKLAKRKLEGKLTGDGDNR